MILIEIKNIKIEMRANYFINKKNINISLKIIYINISTFKKYSYSEY